MAKVLVIPEGWTEGCPSWTEPGNYQVNGRLKLLYWDGNKWHKATKDIFGEFSWHEDLQSQPDVKFYKLIK
jgi:hypothetical protein